MTAPATPEAGTPNPGAPAEATPPPSPANMPQQAPAQAAAEPATPASDKSADNKPNSSARDYDKEVAELRKENANWRTKLREQEQNAAAAAKALEELQAKYSQADERWNSLAAIFNPEAADTPPDPEKLVAQFAEERAQWDLRTADYDSKLSEAEQKIRDLTVRAALPTVLAKAQADPGLTEAVLTASGVLAKLEPTSDTFNADLESAVVAAVEANPRLKVTPVATRSGAEIPGRSGGSDQITREQLSRMSTAEIEKARREGRLRNLLGGGK